MAQLIRFCRDEVTIAVAPPRFLRHFLVENCSVEKRTTLPMAKALRHPSATLPSCGLVCVDFDFSKDLHESVVNIQPLFGTAVVRRPASKKRRDMKAQRREQQALEARRRAGGGEDEDEAAALARDLTAAAEVGLWDSTGPAAAAVPVFSFPSCAQLRPEHPGPLSSSELLPSSLFSLLFVSLSLSLSAFLSLPFLIF